MLFSFLLSSLSCFGLQTEGRASRRKKVLLNKMMARYLYAAFLISNAKRQTSVGAGFPG